MRRFTGVAATCALLVAACGAGPEQSTAPATVDVGVQTTTATNQPTAPANTGAGGSEPAPMWLAPECPYNPLSASFASVWYVLGTPTSWAEYNAQEVEAALAAGFAGLENGTVRAMVQDEDFAGIVDFGSAHPSSSLRGTPPASLVIRIPDATILSDALSVLTADSLLLGFSAVGIPEVDAYGGQVVVAVVFAADERAYFAQECGDRGQSEFDAFAAGQSSLPAWSEADLVRGFADRNLLVLNARDAWAAGPEPVAWEDRDAAERLLDPEATPGDVLSAMTLLSIEFEVPEAWQGRPEIVCTFAPEGWNECVSLDSGGELEVSAYAVEGEGLDVYLLGEEGNIREPLALLGTISSSDLGAWDGLQPISVTIDAATVEEAIAEAGVGQSVLSVR